MAMLRPTLLLLFLAAPQPGAITHSAAPATEDLTSFTADHKLIFPEKYREWIFLSSGIDMSYNPSSAAATHSTFDNVFVNPSAYKAFQTTGTWPDKTILILENRAAVGDLSINKRGHTQSSEVTGLEVHVKDASLQGGWGFFVFQDRASAPMTGRPASCYSCHEQHAAVDTTFVQFYPTLLDLAKKKGTLSNAYLKEMAAPTEAAGK